MVPRSDGTLTWQHEGGVADDLPSIFGHFVQDVHVRCVTKRKRAEGGQTNEPDLSSTPLHRVVVGALLLLLLLPGASVARLLPLPLLVRYYLYIIITTLLMVV